MRNKKSKWRQIAAGIVLAMAISLAAPCVPAQENRKVVSNPTPAYPDIARKMHLAGVVKVRVVIGADGRIKDVKVVGGHPVLVDAVQETLKDWKYAPGSSETTTLLQFNFHE